MDKRYSRRLLFTGSYAFTQQHGLNGILNLDNWFSSWGPQGARHLLNVSGIVDLPWKFQLSFINTMSSTGPFTPSIPVVDFDGDGTSGEPLPGACINCFNRSLGKSDLSRLANEFNQNFAGKRTSRAGQVFGTGGPRAIQLGARFAF